MLHTLPYRYQLSLQSDCLFSQNYIHYENAANNFNLIADK